MYSWDEGTRQRTLKERGLDFADMDRFDWETALIADDIRRDYGETRYVAIGRIGHTVCVVCYTLRARSVRIISLRKASRKERSLYNARQTRAFDG